MNTQLTDIATQALETIDDDLEVVRAILDETARDLDVLREAVTRIERMTP